MQELQRNDALPYAEYYQRPGTALDYAFEWVNFISNRWFSGVQYATNAAIRPRNATGFQYVASVGGLSGSPGLTGEPEWPTGLGRTVKDGSITWKCAAIDNTSLVSTISTSTWSADSGVTISAQALVGTMASVLVNAASNLADGDYYVRNLVTLANSVTQEGLLRISVRAGKLT